MISLKGGVFTMGDDVFDPQKTLDGSKPPHAATVPPFQLDVTEVTVDAYRRCVEDGACSSPKEQPKRLGAPPCSWYELNRGNHPVNCVSWRQADAYCKWAGKQLPTEEMWEFAARGKAGRTFPWGNEVPEPGVSWGVPRDVYDRLQGSCRTPDKSSDEDTIPVGCAPRGATPEGVLDLAGNVMEWTASPYCDYATKACKEDRRVIRGGTNDVFNRGWAIWAIVRWADAPESASGLYGFRCARLDKP